MSNTIRINLQGWEFALSLFALLLKISLLKERPWVICSHRSLKKSASVIHSWFALLLSKNEPFAVKKFVVFTIFLTVFLLFFPFLCSKANRSHRSLLRFSFEKSDRSNFLSLLFTKERLWAISSRRFLKKSKIVNH